MTVNQLSNNKVLTVTELNNTIKTNLENNIGNVQVEGEISNLVIAASGHMYFSIKDSHAQIRCVMFKFQAANLNFKLHNGLKIIVIAKTTIYPGRGDLQLLVEYMLPFGLGKLQIEFNALKTKLENEGLFSAEHKKEIPNNPTKIGVITSLTGAAIADILKILNDRWPLAKVYLYPSQVQGNDAKHQLVNALKTANKHKETDVIILGRGGGSIEDLWPFNEEIVAREIFKSKIPIVSAVGHETDFTITDFVADKRAATPSNAAQIITQDINIFKQEINNYKKNLINIMQRIITEKEQQLAFSKTKIIHPKQKLQLNKERLENTKQHLIKETLQKLKLNKLHLSKTIELLDTVSPLKVLARGHGIVSQNEKVIYSVNEVNINDNINVRIKDGKLNCKILSKETMV